MNCRKSLTDQAGRLGLYETTNLELDKTNGDASKPIKIRDKTGLD